VVSDGTLDLDLGATDLVPLTPVDGNLTTGAGFGTATVNARESAPAWCNCCMLEKSRQKGQRRR
jgi:hypothetical protein